MMKIDETTIDELFNHHYFRLQLHDLVESYISRKSQLQIDEGKQEAVGTVIEEISAAILSISQPNFVKDMEEMKKQINSKYQYELEEVRSYVRDENISIRKCLQQREQDYLSLGSQKVLPNEQYDFDVGILTKKSQGKILKPSPSKPRKERHLLTQSILECSRIEVNNSHLHHFDEQEESIINNGNRTQAVTSWHEETKSLKSRISELEQQLLNVLKKMNKGFQEQNKKIEINYLDLGALKIQTFEKIQNAFSGMWNTISNLEEKFAALETIFISHFTK